MYLEAAKREPPCYTYGHITQPYVCTPIQLIHVGFRNHVPLMRFGNEASSGVKVPYSEVMNVWSCLWTSVVMKARASRTPTTATPQQGLTVSADTHGFHHYTALYNNWPPRWSKSPETRVNFFLCGHTFQTKPDLTPSQEDLQRFLRVSMSKTRPGVPTTMCGASACSFWTSLRMLVPPMQA